MTQWLTIEQTARHLGESEETVRAMIACHEFARDTREPSALG